MSFRVKDGGNVQWSARSDGMILKHAHVLQTRNGNMINPSLLEDLPNYQNDL